MVGDEPTTNLFIVEQTTEIKDFSKYVEETNEAFNNATPAEKRVMIAGDVIARTFSRNIIAKTGAFVNTFMLAAQHGIDKGDVTVSFKPLINESENCEVCGKGALFCAYVGRVNDASLAVATYAGNSAYDAAHIKMREIFTAEQLDLIECAFERTSYLFVADEEDRWKAYSFGERYNIDNDRLIAICENIIENGGEFIP